MPTLSRRTFLRGSGVALALPLLDSMIPAFGAPRKVVRRLVAMETNQGIMPQFFFPEKAGRDYAATPYLERLAAHRNNMTIFSGVSLPGVTGGHAAERCFLTGTPHPERGGFRNWISLDQYAADYIGGETRYPSLVLAMTSEGGQTLSFTRSGAAISAERSPKKVFQKLFVQGKPEELEANAEAIRQGRSMLDFVGDHSRRLMKSLSTADQQRMDQYLSSVRELEKRLESSESWEKKPKPKVDVPVPVDNDDAREIAARTKQMFDVMKLALETDSTRVISLFIDTTVIHNMTHHGGRPEAIADLRVKEESQFDVLNEFLKGLSSAKEEGQPLLDRTVVLYGTNMGSANSHSNVNLPVLLAGGGFKHGQHLAFDQKNNYPLSNLYVSILQRLGIETDQFSTSKGSMTGLEMA
ncbi:MAG TPA: DUF1552 domain-containing protein [Planctomycetota bacterium]|nr:DUF1552 domain-containing protein [Planctomycetota bacterium]